MPDIENLTRKQRWNYICAQINLNGQVSVHQLVNMFGCSEETIRRDLRYLESLGKVVRTFGGATTIQQENIGRSFEKRKIEHVSAKKIMAQKASFMIAPNLTIAMDSSSTCYYLAKALPDVNFKLVTNSLRILSVVKTNPKIDIICTGGKYDEKHGDFTGHSLNLLSNINIDLCFISCVGADMNLGIFDMSDDIVNTKKQMMLKAKYKILLADSSKFNKKTPFKISDWGEINYVVDDGALSDQWREHLHHLNINII